MRNLITTAKFLPNNLTVFVPSRRVISRDIMFFDRSFDIQVKIANAKTIDIAVFHDAGRCFNNKIVSHLIAYSDRNLIRR